MTELTESPPPDTVGADGQPLIEGVDFAPERVPRTEIDTARKLLDRDGAVIVTGWPVEPDSTVNAAAAMLGTRLRELEKLHKRTTESVRPLHRDGAHTLYRDWGHVVVDLAQQPVRPRLPDPDYVLIHGVRSASRGGESVVVDGYRLIDRLKTAAPELYQFLTTVDVDVTSGRPQADGYHMPRLCRMVEWTRGGRQIVRVAQHAQPAPREIDWDEHQRLIDAYDAVLAGVAEHVRDDTVLQAGEVLVLDNYRCLHSARTHEGCRTVHVLRCKSSDA